MNNLLTFNFENRQVRTLKINEVPYFVGKDVAAILGYKSPTKAIQDHVDKEDRKSKIVKKSQFSQKSEIVKKSQLSQNATGYVNVDLITESGVYSLIFGSKLPSAKRFKHWVTSEVLPAIRQHGAYMTDEKAYQVTHDQTGMALADLLQQAANQLRQKDLQIEALKPRARFADAVALSHQSILVGDLAKLLRQNGIDMGQNRLFAWLRDNGYLMKNGSSRNMPTQKSSNLGLFRVVETTITHKDGSISINRTPKVTGKGQQYFVNKFLGGM